MRHKHTHKHPLSNRVLFLYQKIVSSQKGRVKNTLSFLVHTISTNKTKKES